ncbi:MAG: phenylalanine--tRNA ligase subunit alpha [Bacteroidales bacterium]|nr:phenylalanine--tRNA ligase subunit alpha [Bacteroidales bacterium]
MKEKIDLLLAQTQAMKADTAAELEALKVKYLGRKGIVQELFQEFKNVPAEEKRETGQRLNELKDAIQTALDALKEQLESTTSQSHNATNDLTLPVDFSDLGARHPLSIVRNQICNIFGNIGYTIAEGPEIEDDWHNFTALNFPLNHPARDMQDTFFIEKDPDIALRTHTSSVQIRTMERNKPPIRSIFPGRVYRNEAISARAHCLFHQVEGLYIDRDVSFADLKQTLYYFAKEMFSSDTKIRLRPSYFPFTEPSAEMDISCNICGGKGCNICKGSGWVEILGCGMVDPNVLENCGIDSAQYTGFAFGMGIERVTMLKYQINDLRLFFENDVRFLKQFEEG